ncbi:MAG: endonuclease III [Candidatus Omnitrophica bacterium]|nr:endonuclease III [Candidatus Omnitrophota bacterium]
MAESIADKKKRAKRIVKALAKEYPDAECALTFDNPFELLIATILSAQCTDARVNEVTQRLFKKYRTPMDFVQADSEELEEAIRPTGFFRNKAKNIQACCASLVEDHGGEVPNTMEELTGLAGVGRKTANVILGNCFGVPGIVVDTHFGRLSRRMGFTDQQDPVKVEKEVGELIPPKEQVMFCHRMILHGREVCGSRKPQCGICVVEKECPKVGVPTR